MKLHMAIIFALILLCIATHEAEGIRSPKLIPLDKDLELEMQLKILNKPPIKSFQDENEGIIDCINIYKQLAFDNPLLKNHQFQMRPSSLPKGVKLGGKYSSKLTRQSNNKFQGCPFGTVPFKRTRKEDLIRAKTALELIHPTSIINSTSINILPRIHFATVGTLVEPSRKYYGAQIYLSVFNLSVVESQISMANLWIGSYTDGHPYTSIEFGWTVNPQLYKDSQSRSYSLWTGDGFKKTGCYNALCPGYVQVSQKTMMGDVMNPVSVFGQQAFAMHFTLFKDPNTSNWWLLMNLGNNQNEAVGYWPKELLGDMSDSASAVQMGGKIYTPAEGLGHQVPMGSGVFVTKDMTRTCSAFNIEFMNSQFQFYPPKDVPMQVSNDVPDIYKAEYMVDERPSGSGYTLFFGGPYIKK